MSIIRSKRKRHNYSIIDNTGLIDKELTWKATGLLAFLMTKPDNWEINIKALSHNKKDARDSTITALDDLIKAGYVYRTKNRVKGRYNTEYLIFETPADMKEWLESEESNQTNLEPDRENRIGKTGSGKPDRENRTGETETEDPIQVITNKVITDLENTDLETPSISPSPTQSGEAPRGGEREEVATLNQEQETVSSEVTDQPTIALPVQENQKDVAKEEKSQVKASAIAVRENGSQTVKYDPYFYQRRAKPNETQWNWLPDGPWKTEEGKIDGEFVLQVATKWAQKFGDTAADKKPDVMKHFRNDPTNLPIEWEWYQDKFFHKVANIHTRKENGFDTTEDEQAIAKQVRAAAPLNDDQRVSEARTPTEVAESAAPYFSNVATGPSLPSAENGSAYKMLVDEESRDFWRQRYAAPITQQKPLTTTSDELQKAKEAIEHLKKQRAVSNKSKSASSLSDIFAPQDNTAYMLERMQQQLLGTDEMRQEAINWASNPINGCEIIKDKGNRVIGIKELDF